MRRCQKTRNGTFIIPSTGERSRRQFTLRTSGSLPSRSRGSDAGIDAPPETIRERVKVTARKVKRKAVKLWRWFGSDEGHAVLKCTFAYLLGCCGTFFPPLSKFLGHRDGKHIAATITVYFHPARTAGSMIEAVIIALFAIFYAELVALLAMAIVAWGRDLFDIVLPAHVMVLVVCVGGGLGFVGWVKQKMNQPLVNVATTLASISIITVLTKEDSIQAGYFSGEKPIQIVKLLLLGVASTVAVNLLIWPASARCVLRQGMVKASVSLGDRLSFVTKAFLSGSEEELLSSDYAKITTNYNKAYTQMTKHLREAKNEHYLMGHEKLYQLDKSLVKCLEALSQAIGGLRSALDTQFTLLKEVPTVGTHGSNSSQGLMSPQSTKSRPSLSAFLDDSSQRLAVIDEFDEDELYRRLNKSDPSLDRTPIFRTPADIFALFIDLLGPSMKSLAYTLSETLRETPLGKDPKTEFVVNDQLRESLRDAISLYKEARGNALQEVYRSIELGRSRSEKIQADIEEVAAACGHFSFSLLAVAEEMDSYLDVLEDLKQMSHHSRRSWNFLKFWQRWTSTANNAHFDGDDADREQLLPKPPVVNRLRRSAIPKGIPDEMTNRRDTFNWEAAPQTSKHLRTASQLLLRMARWLTREDILFGIKVGIGALLWAMFAFIPAIRPIYQTWRGEWGLLSYMIVNGMTTGAANTTGLSRFYGTIIGGACACLAWLIGQENPFVLAFCSWLMSLYMFYLIAIKNAPLGRMSLLAYNVVLLYAYSISQQVDDPVRRRSKLT